MKALLLLHLVLALFNAVEDLLNLLGADVVDERKRLSRREIRLKKGDSDAAPAQAVQLRLYVIRGDMRRAIPAW